MDRPVISMKHATSSPVKKDTLHPLGAYNGHDHSARTHDAATVRDPACGMNVRLDGNGPMANTGAAPITSAPRNATRSSLPTRSRM